MSIERDELDRIEEEEKKFMKESHDYLLSRVDRTIAYTFGEIEDIMKDFLKEKGEKPTKNRAIGLRVSAIHGKEAILDSKIVGGIGYAFIKDARD